MILKRWKLQKLRHRLYKQLTLEALDDSLASSYENIQTTTFSTEIEQV